MKNNNNIVFGFLLGAAFGTVLGILIAPQEGSKTRKLLADEASRMKSKLDEGLEEYSEAFSEKFKETTEELGKEIDGLLTSATKTTDELIASLEERLEQLKAKNELPDQSA